MPVDISVNDAAALDGMDARGIAERAARAALEHDGVSDGALSVTLMADAGMAAMNRRWKEREGPTDVLAFALHGAGEPVVGDVYVGVDRAREQAAEHGEPVARELARLVVHGTLHVLGRDHPEEGREESAMWREQEQILDGLEGA